MVTKKFVLGILVLGAAFYFSSCSKKQQPSLEQMQEPMSMEAFSKLPTQEQATLESKTSAVEKITTAQPATTPQTPPQLKPLPSEGPAKPTTEEIQTALKNYGYYTGPIDGKKGHLTKKAIEEFQSANGLQVDGKVGPKTWAILSRYLNSPAQPETANKR